MKLLFSITLSLLSVFANAQSASPVELGVGVNLSAYNGDLSSKAFPFTKNANFAFSSHVRRNISNNFALRFNMLAGTIKGDEKAYKTNAWRQERALSFKGPLMEFSLLGEIYPLGIYKKHVFHHASLRFKKRRLVAPFLMIGIGSVLQNPMVNWNDANNHEMMDQALVEIDKSTRSNRVDFVLPFGGGVRFAVNNRLTLGLEGAVRPTFSDYMDGISKVGNPSVNDWFFTAGIAMSYTICDEINVVKPKPLKTRPANGTNAAVHRNHSTIPGKIDGMTKPAISTVAAIDRNKEDLTIGDNFEKLPLKIDLPLKIAIPDIPGTLKSLSTQKVYFKASVYALSDSGTIFLNKVADLLKSEPALFAQIEGFADNTGKRFSNYLLSVQRAKNCFDFLVAAGVPAGRLKYLGYGIARPAASNKLAAGRQLNRRVEIHFSY